MHPDILTTQHMVKLPNDTYVRAHNIELICVVPYDDKPAVTVYFSPECPLAERNRSFLFDTFHEAKKAAKSIAEQVNGGLDYVTF